MMESQEKIDYLAIGHICYDLTPLGKVMGGAAAYASAFTSAAGCRTAVVTSSAMTGDWRKKLPNVKVHRVPSDHTTVFENVYTPSGRIQRIHAVADQIDTKDVPKKWHRASIVHLAPIANEVDPDVIQLFSNSLIGLAPQGWMRHWDNQGHVSIQKWPEAKYYFRKAAVVFISQEEIIDKQSLKNYCEWARLLVLTRGRNGCTVFVRGEEQHFAVNRVPRIDPTGAGDIFAAAFLIRYFQTAGNHVEAANFANRAAALSIGHAGIEAKVNALRRSSLI